MQFSAAQPSAGWYPDPAGSGDERYWDGESWSQVTRPATRPHPTPTRSAADRAAYAGWWRRAAAYVLDVLLAALPAWFAIAFFLPESFSQGLTAWWNDVLVAAQAGSTAVPEFPADVQRTLGIATLALVGLGWVYRTVFIAVWGATVGKMIVRIRVADLTGKRPRPLAAASRALVEMVLLLLPTVFALLLPINYLMPLFTLKKQALHDMVARTVVVKN
ncbi:MAG: RDD family protein [Propionibacteriaceae bacterium]|nr:RDD family protein [Propionibacteriaceae bacterium]